jgi:quercetin dioxygenase-like cupin family protein
MVEHARLEQLDTGLAPVSEGWFVVSVPEAAWVTNEALGAAGIFEGHDVSFPDVGFTMSVLQPGQASRYHREANQEDFLVLAGECLLLIEGEERPLKAWDFVHCPPDTEHAFVATGDSPCVIFMTGARKGWPETGVFYPRSELALRHGAGVEAETSLPAEAYAPFPKWQPGPPADWIGLPSAEGSRWPG